MGRTGFRAEGVVSGGAMDSFAHQVSNWLACNETDCASLEITMGGLQLYFDETRWIALAGCGVQAFINDIPADCWRPLQVQAGSILKIQYNGNGCRSYLAINGGWKVKKLLDSYSTYLPAGWGGYEGRALKKGDQLFADEKSAESCKPARWAVARSALLPYKNNCVVRIIEGAEWHRFTQESRNHIHQDYFPVLPQSNRMGYRLQSNMQKSNTAEMLSTAVCAGTIQALPDGNMVLLMKDAPTTGGYPRIAQVVESDISLIAQLVTGNNIRFTPVSIAQAEEIYLTYQEQMHKLKEFITNRLY